MTDPPLPTFNTREVTEALEISVTSLNEWASPGIMTHLTASSPAPGMARRYTVREVYQLGLIRLLVSVHIPIKQAAIFAHLTVERVYEHNCANARELSIYYFSDGRRPEMRFNDDVEEKPATPGIAFRITINLEVAFEDIKERFTGQPHPWMAAPKRRAIIDMVTVQ